MICSNTLVSYVRQIAYIISVFSMFHFSSGFLFRTLTFQSPVNTIVKHHLFQ